MPRAATTMAKNMSRPTPGDRRPARRFPDKRNIRINRIHE